MKRNLLLTSLFVFTLAGLFAQKVANPKAVQMAHQKAMPLKKTAFTGFEPQHEQASVPLADNSIFDLVGNTVYDLQSNAGVGDRVFNFGNGNVNAVFTLSLIAGTTWTDRGTGINSRNGVTDLWGAPPATRLENIRCGFTNYAVSPNGAEYVVTHIGAGKTHVSKRTGGAAGAWVQSDIPSATLELWPRAAVGGATGNSLHVISSSEPVANGGTTFQGMNGVMLYWRSQDGGATWNIQDMLMPGIDSTQFVGTDIESYAIDANGENISILTTNSWNDCLLFISHDDGTTWEKRVVLDFPLTRYVINAGYDTLSLPPDPNRANLGAGGDPYGIFAADGAADVLVDDQGITHVWYGSTYVSDSDTTDAAGTSSFYPGVNTGIIYWNSLMNDDEGVVSGFCPDIDGNGQLDFAANSISNYGLGLSTHPSGSMDAEGNLFLSYVADNELYNDATSGFNFRQPYIVASTDNGATWNEPKAIMDPVLLDSDSTDIPFLEAIYTTAAKLADDKIHVTFQTDFSPLTNVQSNTVDTEGGDNSIRYVGYPKAWALTTGTKNVPAEKMKFEVTPNPANDRISIQFNSDRTQSSWIELYDIYGKIVRSTAQVTVGAGIGNVNINTADLPTGMYIARLNLGNAFAAQKVSVQH